MNLLVDVNLTPNWCAFLRNAGFEATHWTEIGAAGAADTEIMAHARTHGLVVFTHDLDFARLLALTRATGPSVIQLRAQDTLPSAVGPTVVIVLKEHATALRDGALVTVDPRAARVRILPILP